MDRKKPDYAFKAHCLELDKKNGILKLTKKINRTAFLNSTLPYGQRYRWHSAAPLSYAEFSAAVENLITNYSEEFDECQRIAKADYTRKRRLQIRINYLLEHYDCYFLTLTFTDTVLQNTTSDTRKKYITNFLSSLNTYYIANKDFGTQNSREHYHCIIARRIPTEKLTEYIEKYGACYAEPIKKSELASLRLSKYVSKLTNHAVKETAQRSALLYSRKPSFTDLGI